MKKTLYMGLAVMMAGSVLADPADAKIKLFSRMDVDKDGKVTKEEYMNLFTTAFGNMDKNKDGVLDDTEFKHPAFKHIDTNQDGKIDPAEDKAYRERCFIQLDAGQKGFLTKEEFVERS